MKRFILTVILLLAVVLASCGSEEPGETSVSDVDSLVETKVASTVAAAVGDEEPTVAVEPTFPKVSGDATPLTPIPQYEDEETYIEVSPEVEYAPEGQQDAPVTFDFGGGATATPGAMPRAAVGGTVIPSGCEVGITLHDAKFVDSYANWQGSVEPQEGYRLLQLEYEVTNLKSSLETQCGTDMQVVDRDNDFFYCPVYLSNYEYTRNNLTLRGYGRKYDAICQIPVTAAADDLDGLRAVQNNYSGNFFEFDLGDNSGVATDFSDLRAPGFDSLPLNSAKFCPQNRDLPYELESASWYDAPSAMPPDSVLKALADWSYEQSNNDGFNHAILGELRNAQTQEEREALVGHFWQELWASYDLTDMDVVVVEILTTNLGKQPIGDSLGAHSFASFDSNDPLTAITYAEYVPAAGTFSLLLLPFEYLGQIMPPGGEQRTILYGLVPESASTFDFLHLFYCGNSEGNIVLNLPRQPLISNESLADIDDDSIAIPEHLQHMVDAGAIQVIVEAGQERTNTGIIVKDRQQVTVAYLGGRWRGGPADSWPMVDANGDQRFCGIPTFPYPQGCLMSVTWGIGDSDVQGVMGNNGFVTSPSTGGELWFGPNDDDFSDNDGNLVLLVQLY